MAKLLRNPIYGGVITYFDERHAGEHEPIIDKVTFERAQQLLTSRKRELKFHGLNYDYVLRGLLKCGKCSSPMIPASTRKGRTAYRYYKCSNRGKHGKKACDSQPLSAGAIETYVVERIAEAANSKNLRKEIEAGMFKRLRAKEAEFAQVQSRAPQVIAMHSAKASKLVEELTRLNGRARDVAAESLATTTEELGAAERSLAQAERGVGEVRAAMAEFEPVLDQLKNFTEVWAVMTPANRVRFMAALIEEIVVDEKKGEVSISMVDFESVVAA